MWYGADPSSLEYYLSMELCANPEEDYYINNPPIITVAEIEETLFDAEDTTSSMKISVWWFIIGVTIFLIIIAIILVLILWRAYKMQQKS